MLLLPRAEVSFELHPDEMRHILMGGHVFDGVAELHGISAGAMPACPAGTLGPRMMRPDVIARSVNG
jgi:hypothetical protein